MTTFTLNAGEHQTIQLSGPGEYEVILAGEGAQATVRGAFRVAGNDRQEVSVLVRHQAKHTRAETILKGVASDASYLKISGRIIIDEDCGDTNSFLTERILLLSPLARAEAVPDLEIKTDDVKCSHAASISKIPEEQLFYLRTRGISQQQAEQLIVEGFLQ